MQQMSLGKKLILASIPLILGSLYSAFQIYKASTITDSRAEKAILLERYTTEAQIEMVAMSEKLRGFLLDPTRHEEVAQKKAADKAYVENSKKLASLTESNPQIRKIIHEMMDFDEKELDHTENEIAELAQTDINSARKNYFDVYVPLRLQQNDRFQKLKELISIESKNLILESRQAAMNEGYLCITILLGALIVGLFFIQYTIVRVTRSLNSEVSTLTKSDIALNETSDKLNSLAEKLLISTNDQASSVQESISALTEMTSMIQQTSDSTTHSLENSKKVSERSIAGQEIMQKMTNSMGAIDQASQSLQNIAKIIHEINSKAAIINDIVFKTQLLSFNASIEAARAGQYGKGFAVVAEEVGNLAQMSGNSAREIEELLADSQKQVTSTLELIRLRVGEGKVVTNESVRAFNEISDSVQVITEQIKSISDATTQQNVGINQIQKAISQLDEMARKNTVSANQTLQSAKSISSISKGLADASQHIQLITFGKSKSKTHLVETSTPNVNFSAEIQVTPEIEQLNADDNSFKRAA